jgi:S-adenosylmethionine-dependent methyltransferase
VLRLAAAGHHVTGAEVSAEMLGRAKEKLAAAGVADRVRLLGADIYDLPFDGEVFDAVVCHGVVMYLPDSTEPVSNLARLVAPGGLLSILTKNALAVGNLGIVTRGDTPEHLDQLARDNGLTPLPWQGVRVFHDHVAKNWQPEPEAFAKALAVEWAASSRSPYRELGRLVHAVARREATS